MNVTELLHFADELVFAETGKHLNNLQKAVLQGILQEQDYEAIAKNVRRDERYLRNIGSELWQTLSKALGEKINKSNCKAVIERQILTLSNIAQDFVNFGSINLCTKNHSSKQPQSVINKKQQSNKIQPRYIDLDDAPSLNQFYGRCEELQILNQWIIADRSRLVAIIGLPGIGKTSLVLQLIEELKEQFDYIIWRNLQDFYKSESLQQELITIEEQQEGEEVSAKAQLRTLMKYLRKYRCLIILDNVESLFICGQLAGTYQAESQSYHNLFKSIAESCHQSCFVLISQEKSREICQLEGSNPAVFCLQLKGLDSSAVKILDNYQLQERETWSNLIELYQGHPLWLQLIAKTIQDLAQGKVTDLFEDDSLLLTEEFRDYFNSIYQRLSSHEKIILTGLAKHGYRVNLSELKLVDLPQMELLDGVRSLSRRCLLEMLSNPELNYAINPVIRQLAIAQTVDKSIESD